MRQLSLSGLQAIQDVAQRHGFSSDAVQSMLNAVVNGNGSMAQFSHPEFGGSGQWMSGGMTMIGDMFNNHLKGRVDNLCADLAQLVNNQPHLLRTDSFQSQSQGGNLGENQSTSEQFNSTNTSNAGHSGTVSASNSGYSDSASLFVPLPTEPDWWGPDLRWPNSTGSQNGLRYAWFAQVHRLAIDFNGQVTVYDTLDHQIGGVSQQQSGGFSVTFTSQYGYVDLTQLPVVSVNGVVSTTQSVPSAPSAPSIPAAPAPAPYFSSVGSNTPPSGAYGTGGAVETDIFASIEKLAQLQARGILTVDEFSAKKAELLSRL